MEPQIIHREAFTVLGLEECFPDGQEDFEGIWKRYMRYHAQIEPHSIDGAHYGVCFAHGEFGVLVYLAGMWVTEVGEVPEGLTQRTVPASRYAVFTCTVPTIGETYDRIFGEWLKSADVVRPAVGSPKADFEQYGDPVLIHIALEDA